ncbi:MAG: metal-dependent transcriptional regulator [Bacteroidota bacterium]
MSPAALNLIIFFSIVLVVGLALLLTGKRISIQGKFRKLEVLREDILKQLFHVENGKRTATISDLSGVLKISRTKLLPIIESMTSEGDINLEDDKLFLSEAGKEKALKIIRTHRLWEKYLAEKTGHEAEEWHYMAEQMEHKLDDNDLAKLTAILGDPLYDPHGDPIPSKEGQIIAVKWQPLPSFPVNQPGKIVHIEDEPAVVYEQILEKRIFIGSHIIITRSSANEIVFKCEGQEHKLSPIVAANINIEPLDEGELFEDNAIRLSALKTGESASIIGLSQECRGANRRRLLDLGLLPGTEVKVDMFSPMKDPVAYQIRNTSIALRNSLADLVLIKKLYDGKE